MDFEDPVQDMNTLYETVCNLYMKVGKFGIKRNNLWIKNMAINLKTVFDQKNLKSDYFDRTYEAIMGIFE